MGGLLSEGAPRQKLLEQISELLTPEVFSRRRAATKHLGPTAWLDGLRGWAALCVAFMHLTVYTHDGIELCYGSKFRHSDEHNVSPAALPIIRLPFTGGHFSVMLFFVISGYVVPRRLLQHLQDGRRQEFWEDLQSAMVRRPVRLFLPVILSTIFIFISWHLFGTSVPHIPKQKNIISEAWSWLWETLLFSYPYRIGWLYTYYNVHTWTIPMELRGSMLLFVYLMTVHSVKTKTRVLMTLGVVVYLTVATPGAWYATFFGGMFLCELDLIATAGRDVAFAWDRLDKWLRSNKPIRNFVLHTILFASLWLATQPSSDWSTRAETLGNCPGWKTLSAMIPASYYDLDSQYRWFWLFWAAWMLVYAVREINWLRACFETQTAQYLGKHSFALYLVHGPMIAHFSEKIFYLTGIKQAATDDQKEMFGAYQNKWHDAPWWPLPDGGPAGLEPNFLFCVAVSIPVFLYTAELGTKAFDAPSIKASRWAWQKWKSL